MRNAPTPKDNKPERNAEVEFLGGYLNKKLATEVRKIAKVETRGNVTHLLEIFALEGVRHRQESETLPSGVRHPAPNRRHTPKHSR